MKRRHPAAAPGLPPVISGYDGHSNDPASTVSIPWPVPSVLNPERQMMAVLVETSSRACARDVVEGQAAGQLGQAYRNGPANVIAQLVDAGRAGWVRAFFEAFVRSLHDAEKLVGLEAIRSESALTAISEYVVAQAKDIAAWQGILRNLEPDDFPGWPDTVN